MALEKTLRALSRALETDTCVRNSDQPDLVDRGPLVTIVSVLADRSTPWPDRESITRALIRAHRRGGTSMYGVALLVAYTPMLVCVRRRVGSDEIGATDLDQIVIAAFLEAVAEFEDVDHPTHVAIHLRRATARAVVRRAVEARRERDWFDECAATPDIPIFDRRLRDASVLDGADEIDALAELVREIAPPSIAPGRIERIITTRLRGARLRSFVDSPREWERAKRERTRALRSLRAALVAACERDTLDEAWRAVGVTA